MYEGDSPHRRAPGRRARPRPGAARRAARPGRAARAARPRGAGRGRGRAAAARPRTAGPATPRASPTCCGCSARCPPTRSRRGASTAPTVADWLAAARRRPPRRRGPDGRRASAGPRSRTSAGCATRSASRCRPASPTRSPSRSTTRSATWSAASPAPTARSPPPTSPRGSGSASPSRRQTLPRLAAPGPGARGRVPARRRRAPSGATPRCCAGCGAGRWPRCARRSSRSSRRRSAGSCRPGSTSPAARGLRGVDGVLTVVEQLAGCAVPACALESLVLAGPGRRLPARRCSTS